MDIGEEEKPDYIFEDEPAEQQPVEPAHETEPAPELEPAT